MDLKVESESDVEDNEASEDCSDYNDKLVRPSGRARNKKTGRNVACTHCGKMMYDRRNLNRHLRSIHGIQPEIRKMRMKCAFSDSCSFICATSTVLRNHLESVHEFSITEEKFNFQNRTDFEKWKEEEELKSCARYVTDTGIKVRNEKKICYLRCHRSGKIRAVEDEKKRLRSKPVRGYTQCGLTCPSSMQIVENKNGSIDVCYFPKHLGHKTGRESVKYMKLTQKEKEEIAAKLVEGEPISKIVCEARERKRGKTLSRVNFLQKRDVHNIKSKVKYLEKEMDQDGKIIDSWVKEFGFRHVENSPIVLYKPIDKENDYILVMIHYVQKIMFSLMFDGSIIYIKTNKGKANIDFNLTAVYMINENGNGYPLAFCLSNKNDYPTILTFFKVIFDTYGVINTHIFFSDNINNYYVAWKNVMGNPENKLICNFNIHSYWDEKLLEMKCPFNKHQTVSDELRSLLNEMDANVFDSKLDRLLNVWSEDDDLKSFAKFFYKYYCKKPYEWANCHRIHSSRKENINKYIEPLYDQVGRLYTEGTKNLYNALNLILLTIRNDCYINLIKRDEDIISEKMKEIEKNHANSEKVVEITLNDGKWAVRSPEGDFTVQKEASSCSKECGLICHSCDICIHSFTCFCGDYLLDFSICSHIHAVASSNVTEKGDFKNLSEENFVGESALKISAITLSKTITECLEHSDLTDVQYDNIITDLNKLITEYSLNDKVDNCLRKVFWSETC